MFSIYIKGLVVNVSLVISFNINKWLKALLANIVFIKVALLDISSPKAVK